MMAVWSNAPPRPGPAAPTSASSIHPTASPPSTTAPPLSTGSRASCWVKTKPATDRFSIHNATVTFRELGDVFSQDEIGLLTRFAETMELDCSAFDVLRDRASGRIYVVDVNKTDTGPAVDLSFRCREKLKRSISQGFLEMVRERSTTA